MKLISMNRIGPVLRCKWYAIFINMQISGQICKFMAINIEIPFLLIISVQNLTTEMSLSIKVRSKIRIRNF